MRKFWTAVLMEAGIGAVALFVEQRFAVPGDILWAGLAIAAFGGIGVLYSPEILRWLRKISAPRVQTTAAPVEHATLPLPKSQIPEPTKWLKRAVALEIMRHSTLVVAPPDDSDIEKIDWEDKQHYQDMVEREQVLMYLEDFKLEHPEAFRRGRFGSPTLQWWIAKKAMEKDA